MPPPANGWASRVSRSSSALIDLTLAGTKYDTIKSTLDVLLAAPEFDAVVAVPGSSARFTPEISVAPIMDSADSPTPLAVFVVPSAPDALRLLRQQRRARPSGLRSPAPTRSPPCSGAFGRERPDLAPARSGATVTYLDEDESYEVLRHVGVTSRAAGGRISRRPPRRVARAGSRRGEGALGRRCRTRATSAGSCSMSQDAAGCASAAERIAQAVAAARPELAVDRLLVQQQGRGSPRSLIGFRRDPDVGSVVVLAAGGVLAELYRDRSVRLRRSPWTRRARWWPRYAGWPSRPGTAARPPATWTPSPVRSSRCPSSALRGAHGRRGGGQSRPGTARGDGVVAVDAVCAVVP